MSRMLRIDADRNPWVGKIRENLSDPRYPRSIPRATNAFIYLTPVGDSVIFGIIVI